MNGGATYFLTINAGSSSIKFCLFDAVSLEPTYVGTIAGIGFDKTNFTVESAITSERFSQEIQADDHRAAIRLIYDWTQENINVDDIAAVGHRVVHGGPNYSKSCVITDEVIHDLHKLVPLDPEHLPNQIAITEQTRKYFPHAFQIACFDTAFFHDLPISSRLLPLPRKYESMGLRRYGFHGLSYTYLLSEFGRIAGDEAAKGKIIFAHLGNGASLAAVRDGKPIDTSMGLTPAGGIPMSTRSGDIDPGVMTYLTTHEHIKPDRLGHVIGFESGLLGISETTSDMKKLLDLETTDPRAKDAVDIFCYDVKKYIGAYAAALGGINSLVFSGGIGEVSAPIRSRICEGLEFLGISLDAERNAASAERISVDGSGVGVHVIVTNEALTMARDIKTIIRGEQ